MSEYNNALKKGDHIEFLSDAQTDKGPCTATVVWILDGLVCLNHGGDYSHLPIHDIEINRVSTHAKTGNPLFFAK